MNAKTVYVSKPTWGNHKKIIDRCGFTDIREYKYYNPANNSLDFVGLIDDLQVTPEGSVVLLHACAHNPTGVDPNKDEWKGICDIVQKRKLIPVFDLAYQGFVSGDPDTDAWAVRYFVAKGLELFICQSFAKVFGLYNERCGCMSIVCKNSTIAMHVLSQLKAIIRPMYSNPPNHGARIVTIILSNPTLVCEW